VALQQDILNRLTRVHWVSGAWLIVELEMMSSQGGGDADLTFDIRLTAGAQPRKFSVKSEHFVQKRFSNLSVSVPLPGPPEKWQDDTIFKKATAFNYDDAVYTGTIVAGAGGIDHRNIGLKHGNVFFFDISALRKVANLSPNAPFKVKFEPSMDFTVNTVGGSAATPITWVLPAYVFRWTGIEDGVAMSVYDHTDYNYLVFDTKEAAEAFAFDWFSASTKPSSHPLYGWNYPGSGPVGSQWSGAQIMNTPGYNIYQSGGPAIPPEYYGDAYSLRIMARTYKSIKEYYLEKFEVNENGYDYDDVIVHGKFADLYEYKVGIYIDGYDRVTRQITKNGSFFSSIDMTLPSEIEISIDKDLKITGPEPPNDDPETGEEGEGPR